MYQVLRRQQWAARRRSELGVLPRWTLSCPGARPV